MEVCRLGGVARWVQLRQAGVGWAALADDVGTGRLVRPARGIYAVPWVEEWQVAAARWRASLACVSAAAHYGLHVWHAPTALHLSSPVNTRPADGTVVLHRARAAYPAVVPPLRAMLEVAQCLPAREALVVVESAVARRLVTRADLLGQTGRGSARLRSVALRVDPQAQSPAETLARDALLRAGYRVRSQVPVPGVGHVDLEVEGMLLVEIDGRTHHSEAAAFEQDRRRGNAAAVGRRFVLRVPARWVLERPESVVDEVRRWFAVADHHLP